MITSAAGTDWGSVPDWIGGLGTALSLLVVSFGLIHEIRRRRLDDRANIALQEESERGQARLVRVEVDTSTDFDVLIKVTNDSRLPVYNLMAYAELFDDAGLKHHGAQSGSQQRTVLPDRLEPGQSVTSEISYTALVLNGNVMSHAALPTVFLDIDQFEHGIRYSDKDEYFIAFWRSRSRKDLAIVNFVEFVGSVKFTDALGRRWENWMGDRAPSRQVGPTHQEAFHIESRKATVGKPD